MMEVDGRTVGWVAHPGSQVDFIECPIYECLYHGNRGPGKTDALLMSFAQFVGKGFGRHWRGILFRQTYPQLQECIDKAIGWFQQVFGDDARYDKAKSQWSFKTGEQLFLRHMRVVDDYWNYHGHEYPWIGWEELTSWSDDKCYKKMMACSRSSNPDQRMPRMVRATTNPYGRGHNWVKARFRLPAGNGTVIRDSLDDDGLPEPPRIAIQGHLRENISLMQADPNYLNRIRAAAENPAELEAWINGSWDITSGGMFDDIWIDNRKTCVIEPFPIPPSWRIDRAFDWGSSKPWAYGMWAESDGSDVQTSAGLKSTVRGDLFLIREGYGWRRNRPNEGRRQTAAECAAEIAKIEIDSGYRDRIQSGPADSSIFDVENGRSIASDLSNPVRLEDGTKVPGLAFQRADKSPGSRKTGWQQMRKYLKDSVPEQEGFPRERPGIFIFKHCEQWLRTVPSLPRDDKDPDDADTEAEDHMGDMTRYRVRNLVREARSGRARGLF
jgi:hypothetical protein